MPADASPNDFYRVVAIVELPLLLSTEPAQVALTDNVLRSATGAPLSRIRALVSSDGPPPDRSPPCRSHGCRGTPRGAQGVQGLRRLASSVPTTPACSDHLSGTDTFIIFEGLARDGDEVRWICWLAWFWVEVATRRRSARSLRNAVTSGRLIRGGGDGDGSGRTLASTGRTPPRFARSRGVGAGWRGRPGSGSWWGSGRAGI